MREQTIKSVRRARRRKRVRKRIFGTPQRPRLSVARSHRNVYAQIIDDLSGRTLCAVSSQSPAIRGICAYGGNIKAAAVVGKAIAEKAVALGIEKVVFDRGAAKFHGRVKALAQAAREAGLKF